MEPINILKTVPVALWFAVGLIGIGPAEFSRRGFFVLAWTSTTIIMLAIGILTENTVLVPYRMFQYMILPIGLMAGWGVVYLADSQPGLSGPFTKNKKVLVAAAVALLIAITAVTSQPSRELLGGFEEGTQDLEMDGVLWCREEIPVRGTMVASDHRMSSMLFGFAGLNGTWDSAYHTFHSGQDQALASELESVDAPAGEQRIDYVFLDDPIKEGVALEQWENAEPMSDEAIDKFEEPPFQKIFESNGVEVYFVGE